MQTRRWVPQKYVTVRVFITPVYQHGRTQGHNQSMNLIAETLVQIVRRELSFQQYSLVLALPLALNTQFREF